MEFLITYNAVLINTHIYVYIYIYGGETNGDLTFLYLRLGRQVLYVDNSGLIREDSIS